MSREPAGSSGTGSSAAGTLPRRADRSAPARRGPSAGARRDRAAHRCRRERPSKSRRVPAPRARRRRSVPRGARRRRRSPRRRRAASLCGSRPAREPAHRRAPRLHPECSRRGRKGDEERVPLRVDLHAALRGERLSQHAAMVPERGRVLLGAQLVQQGGRALDVREEERDGSRREITPHRCHHAPEKTPTSSDSSPMAPPLHRYRAGLYALTVVPRAPNFCALRRVSSKLERA